MSLWIYQNLIGEIVRDLPEKREDKMRLTPMQLDESLDGVEQPHRFGLVPITVASRRAIQVAVHLNFRLS